MSVVLGGLTALTEYGVGASIPFANGIRLISAEDLSASDVPVLYGDKLGFSFWNSLRLTLGELIKTETDIPNNDLYFDRILTRELTKAVMAANIDSYDDFPNWIKDGVPALVHGIDDIMAIARRYLLSNPMHLWLTLKGQEDTIDTTIIKYPVYDYPTFAGYLALRYMAYQTISGMTPIVPDTAEEFIIRGLNSDWVKESLKLLKNSFGMSFDEDGTSVTDIFVIFKSAEDGTLAYVTSYFNPTTGKSVGLSLTVNMNYYNGISFVDENGDPQNGQTYLDRVLAHEFTHAVMSANIDFFADLPAYIKEGAAELVHGIDDERGVDILTLAGDNEKMEAALSPSSNAKSVNVDGVYSPSYAAGYILFRYMANNVEGRTAGDVIKYFMKYLDDTPTTSSSDILNTLDDAVAYASNNKWANMSELHTDILQDIYLINYTQTPIDFLEQKCNINLTNIDTGAITGFDADFNNPIKTKEDVVPENNFGSWTLPENPTTTFSGLRVHWPAGYITSIMPTVVLTYTTQISIIQAMMEILDSNGSGDLDNAINTATTGIFKSAEDLTNKLFNAVASKGISYGDEDAMKSFLSDECGIYLDNLDTGSLTGFDVSGLNHKSADGVVPELIAIADWNPPLTNSSLINDLNVVWDTPDIVDLGTYINETSRTFMLRGLETVWIESALNLIYESLGMKFGVSMAGGRGTTSVNELKVQFVNDVTSPDKDKPAVMTFGYNGIYANELTLKINMRYYNSINLNNPNGDLPGSSEYSINVSIGCIGDGFVSGKPFTLSKPAESLDFNSWTNGLRQNFSDIAIYNLGEANEDSGDTFNRFISDVTEIAPEYCLIMTGLEEAYKSYELNAGDPNDNPLPYIAYAQSIFDNIKNTIDMARSYGMSPIVSYAVLPDLMIKQGIESFKSSSASVFEIEGCKMIMTFVLDNLKDLVGTYTYHKLEFIDFGVVFTEPYTDLVHDELFDSGFPNIEGYSKMGDLFVRKLVVLYYDYYTKKEGWRYVFDLDSHSFRVYDSNNSIVKSVNGVQALRDLQIDFTIFNSSNFEVLYNAIKDLFYIPATKLLDVFDGISHEYCGVQNINLPDSETEDYEFRFIPMEGSLYVGYYDSAVLDANGDFVRFRQGISPVSGSEDFSNKFKDFDILKYSPSIVPEVLGWYARFLQLAHSNYFYIFEGEVLKGTKLYEEFDAQMYMELYYKGLHWLLSDMSKTMYPAINPVLRFGEVINNRPIYESWLIWNVFNQLFQKYNRVLPPPGEVIDEPYSEDKEGYIVPTLDLSPNMSY